ncbi:hypothetical protein GCM10007908_24220 [Rhizobium albus]|nr:hypothetical protein GCM10007908_24220 [Rhizobium albus]
MRQKQQKLFSTHPAEQVVSANAGEDSLRELNEHGVTHIMPKLIIDRFEPIEVQEGESVVSR